MTTRDLSRTVMAAFAALTDRTAGGVGTLPATGHSRSTGGSTPLKISGSGFQPGAVVLIDGIAMSAFVLDSQTIYACAPPHDGGKADVVIMNPDGSSALMTNGYTFISPRLFDFNGDWIGVAGSEHQMELRFTVRDNALMLNALAGYDPLDPSSSDVPTPDYLKALKRPIRGMAIGIPKERLLHGYHSDVLRAFEGALALLTKMGARVREIEIPASAEAMDQAQRVVRIVEAACYHESFLASRADRYAKDSHDVDIRSPRRDMEAGMMITGVQYLRAQRVKALSVREMSALFSRFDVFLSPGRPAPAGEPVAVEQDFSRMFNCSGFPALALPAGFSTSPPGLPVGLQIAAGPFQEENIYAVAHAYESATGWHRTRPPI